jgi:precorrin-2 dehydrogenase/sirohydrochlorin ferrochelatase
MFDEALHAGRGARGAKRLMKDKGASFYPVGVRIRDARCLVVGGGKVAERKVGTLLSYGARVIVVSPHVTRRLARLAAARAIALKRRRYRRSDIRGAFIVFAATDDRELNARISRDALPTGALVNVVDDPALCSFIVPAVARKGALQIAILTDGKSPSLGRRIRDRVADSLDSGYAGFLDFLGELRREIVEASSGSRKERLRRLRLLADERLFLIYKRRGRRAAREAARKLIMGR